MKDIFAREPNGEAGLKVILLGEHSVVYGYPALVLSTRKATRVWTKPATQSSISVEFSFSQTLSSDPGLKKDLQEAFEALLLAGDFDLPTQYMVQSDVPPGAGLGCSASIGVGLARAGLFRHKRKETLENVALIAGAWEKIFHTNPSGIDVSAVAKAGLYSFQKNNNIGRMTPVKIPTPLTLVVALSSARSSTKKMVAKIATNPERNRPLLHEIATLTNQGKIAIANSDASSLGKTMDENHALLQELDLSTPELDSLCEIARKAGAFGAKLTGSGGGGCMMALCDKKSAEVVTRHLQKASSFVRRIDCLPSQGDNAKPSSIKMPKDKDETS